MHQQELLARIVEVLRDDSRVLGAWLTGSRARGTEDPFSDIDMWLVVTDADKDGFVEDWPQTVEKISPTVLSQPVFGTTFTHITPEWLRLDVSIGTPADVPTRAQSTLKILFDRTGLSAQLMPLWWCSRTLVRDRPHLCARAGRWTLGSCWT